MFRGTAAGIAIRYHEVRWLYDINDDGRWDDNIIVIDQISDKGMTKRTLDLRNILLTNENNPDGYAWIDIKDEFVANFINVP